MKKRYQRELLPLFIKSNSFQLKDPKVTVKISEHNTSSITDNTTPTVPFGGSAVNTIVKNLEEPSLEYLRLFFNFGYFFYYLPYRFNMKINSKFNTVQYNLVTTKLHQCICGLVHLFTAFRFITVLREVDTTGNNPTSYFVIVRMTATAIYMLTFMVAFWKNRPIFVEIFKELNEKGGIFNNSQINFKKDEAELSAQTSYAAVVQGQGQHQRIERKISKSTAIAFTLCTIYSTISILNVICGHGFLRISEWNFTKLLIKHGTYSQFMFFLKPNITIDANIDELQNIPTYLLTLLHLIVHFYFKLGAHYADLSILMCALTLQHLAKQFTVTLMSCKGSRIGSVIPIQYQDQAKVIQPLKILEQYNALKSLAKKINAGIGAVTFCCMFEAMPYYATHIGEIIQISDWFIRFRYCFFIVNFVSIVLISADVSYKIGSLQEWLNEDDNHYAFPDSKLLVLTSELTSHRIGLTAMVFTITYGFIGSLVSVVVTYVVIILQFEISLQSHTYYPQQ